MATPPRSEPTVPTLGAWGRSNLLWLAVSISMLGLVAAAAWVVVSDTGQPLPPFLDPNGATATAPLPPSSPTAGLRLAGSGSNLPLTRALSAAFPRDRDRDPHPVVHASIGSGGGVRALLDGVIDVALVSRPLREGEREQGLVVIPYARVPVVVAAHDSVPERALTSEQLISLYAGTRSTWSDGSRVVVLQRERGDSSHAAVDKVLPGFAEANEAAYQHSRWRVLYRDEAMREALADTHGAIGLFGQGAVPASLPVRPLPIDGVNPDRASVRRGTYPFTKDFAFVTRGAPTGQARAFIDFSLSPAGRRIIEQAGGIPLDGRPLASPEDR
ncbi:MAG: substrate-binding domain-containing protein [Myxococcota bacterium]